MLFRFIWVDKTRNEPLRLLVEDYLARLQRFTRCEIQEIRASGLADGRASSAEESRRVIAALRAEATVILLDVEGREWSSPELGAQVEQWQNGGGKEIAFIIGGAYGVSDELKARAARLWSLSRLTLTHEMARVVMLEQLYRAYTIVRGLPYQK